MDLNTIFGNQDRHIEAIRAASAALDLASTDDEKTRALGDICVGLVDAGSPRPAIPMLKYVLQAAPCESTRINARLELMRIDVMLGNRIGFERSRESLEEICDAIAPSFAVDFRYKVALGHARFGRKKRARELLEEASAIAKMGNLVVWSRKLEKVV